MFCLYLSQISLQTFHSVPSFPALSFVVSAVCCLSASFSCFSPGMFVLCLSLYLQVLSPNTFGKITLYSFCPPAHGPLLRSQVSRLHTVTVYGSRTLDTVFLGLNTQTFCMRCRSPGLCVKQINLPVSFDRQAHNALCRFMRTLSMSSIACFSVVKKRFTSSLSG